MKKILMFVSALLLGSACVVAQTTAVTATVVDSDGTAWANAPWSLSFQVGPNQSNPALYTIGGSALDPAITQQSGAADGSGVITFTVYRSTSISPIGSSWNFTVCPNASARCSSFNFNTSGTTLNLSTQINAGITAPRFQAISGNYGYSDSEAILALKPGSTYWNVTSSVSRCYTGSAWGVCSTGGSGSGTVSGQTANVIPLGSSATVIGAQSGISINTTALATPSAPVVSVTCVTGCTENWSYGIAYLNNDGSSALSALTTCTNGPANIDTSNYCSITLPNVPANTCTIYRHLPIANANGWTGGALVDSSNVLYTHACDGSIFKDDASTYTTLGDNWSTGGLFAVPSFATSSIGALYSDRYVSSQFGVGSSATGTYAFSVGPFANANGDLALAIGAYATSLGPSAIAVGNCLAGHDNDICMGIGANATNSNAQIPGIAIGYSSQTTNGIAIGPGAKALGNAVVSIGRESVVEGNGSTAIGYALNAIANQATVIGYGGFGYTDSTDNTIDFVSYDPTGPNSGRLALRIDSNKQISISGVNHGTVESYVNQLIGGVTVALLPACNSTFLGSRVLVTDSNSAAPGTPVVGSGTFTIAVQCIFNSSGSAYSWIVD